MSNASKKNLTVYYYRVETLNTGLRHNLKSDLHRREIIIGASLALISLVISLFAHFESHFPGDLEVARFIQSFHNNGLLTAMKSISYVTGGWLAAILVAVSCIVVWRWIGRIEGLLMAVVGLTTLIAELLKIVINRPRPTADLVTIYVYESSKSFPSGHSFFSMLFFGMLGYLAVTHLHKTGIKILILSILSILILWVGFSRVYLGAHLPSDVVGGYIIGGLFLMVLIWLYNLIKLHRQKRKA
jgi:membrane-associated phospholipid phosphatase